MGLRTFVLLTSVVLATGFRPALADTAPAPAAATAPASASTVPAPAALPPDHPPIVPGPEHKKAAALTITPELLAKLPAPASRQVDFVKDIKPLFDASCVQCHAKGKTKGGLSLETRDALLKGGESGPAVVPGKSAESRLVHLVAALDPENVMPMKGTKWTPDQVALVRAWIDQGAAWEAGVTFARPAPLNLRPRPVVLPDGPESHPIDRLLGD
jgi:mono/diheme cytochrome c family protein